MDWGWRNESRYTGELVKFWHSTTTVKKHVPDAHHTIKTSAVYIGKDKLRSRRELTAGIDSTSSYIALPFPMALHYYKKLRKKAARRFQLPDGYEGWHVPCTWNPPDIVVTFSNLTLHDRTDDEKKLFRPPKQHEPEVLKNYTIPGDRLLLREPGTELCLGAVVGRIQKQNSDFLLRQKHRWPEVVLGWPFLKNKFIEIDRLHGIYIAEAA